jgi:hypothetical protein
MASVIHVSTAPGDDELVVTAVRAEVQAALVAPPSFSDPVVKGVARQVLDSSSDAALRRLKAVVDTTELLVVQKARAELQLALSEKRLGKINGVRLESFSEFSADEFAGLFASLALSYPRGNPRTALHFVAKKGTPEEELDSTYEATLLVNGWSDEGLKRVFDLVRCVNHVPTGAEVKAFSTAPAQAFLDFLETNLPKMLEDYKSYSDGLRRLGLREVLADFSSERGGDAVREEFDDILAARPSRPLAEVASDLAASDFERYSALAKARNAGVEGDDPHVAAVYGRMTKVLRLIMTRQSGMRQKWASQALMASDRLWKAERAAEAARTTSA